MDSTIIISGRIGKKLIVESADIIIREVDLLFILLESAFVDLFEEIRNIKLTIWARVMTRKTDNKVVMSSVNGNVLGTE